MDRMADICVYSFGTVSLCEMGAFDDCLRLSRKKNRSSKIQSIQFTKIHETPNRRINLNDLC